ncbi:MAG: hypothetical protein QX197_09860 [Methylococcaceae bacterium]
MIKNIVTIALILIPAWGFTQELGDVQVAENKWIASEEEQVFLMRENDLNSSKEQKELYSRYRTTLTRMPSSIGTPSYSGVLSRFSTSATFTFWREDIDGKQRLFVQLNPATTTGSFFFCPGGSQFSVIQNGSDYGKAFNTSIGDGTSISSCKDYVSPQIFLVDQWPESSKENFKENIAFAFSFADKDEYHSGSINVDAAPTSVPTPTPTSVPTSVPTPTPIYTPPTNTVVDEYNSNSFELILPKVKVGNDEYSVILINEGDYLFRLKSAVKK